MGHRGRIAAIADDRDQVGSEASRGRTTVLLAHYLGPFMSDPKLSLRLAVTLQALEMYHGGLDGGHAEWLGSSTMAKVTGETRVDLDDSRL